MYNTTFTTVDDTSPSITYSGIGWSTGGTSDEYNSTTHGISTAGSIATFTFNGSFVEVFGTIGLENNGGAAFAATSSYTIDNNSDSTVQFTGAIGSVTLYKQLFYTSNVLDEGSHTLSITYTSPGKNPLWLDFFRVTSFTQLNTTTPSSSDQPTSNASPSSSSLSPGAIAGIAIGGCAALVLIVIIFVLLRSLTRESKSKSLAESIPKQDRENKSHFLWFRKKRELPPAELTPFDPYTATPSRSSTIPFVRQHELSTSLEPGPGFDADALYTREIVGFTTCGGRSSDKRARHSHIMDTMTPFANDLQP